MKTLVTGAGGFVGSHLCSLLSQSGADPAGLALGGKKVDLRDARAVDAAIGQMRPAAAYHLAAQGNVGVSWQDPDATREINVTGTRNLFDSLARHAPRCKVLFASTGAVYGGPAPGRGPLGEDRELRPQNPYAESKAEAESICREFHEGGLLDVRVARPLGHTGPGQRLGAVAPDFASQIARIKLLGLAPEIKVGNLDIEREFGDVRDVVRAYALIVEKGEPGGAYNIGTGDPRKISEVAAALMAAAGVDVELVPDPGRIRKADESTIRLDTSRLEALGHRRAYDFETTMADVMKDWLKRTAAP